MTANRVLFLTTLLPGQQTSGGEVASQAFIDGLRQNGYEVSVIGYTRKGDGYSPKPYEQVVEERYIETSKAKTQAIMWLVWGILLGLPYSAAKYYSKAYIRLVKSLLRTYQYDVVVIDHSQLSWLAKFIERKARLIFIAHNVEHEIYSSHFHNASNPLAKWLYAREADLVKILESGLAKNASEVWTLTEEDAGYFSGIEGKDKVKVLALPPGPEKTVEESVKKRFDIGLIGSWTWKFNEEGLQWFFKFIYPELSEQVSIHVAGKGAEWLEGKYPNVSYEGFVPNAQVFMAQAKVVALPILGGSGIQIKTLDALASGSAIVATPQSMRGISLSSSAIQVAENPKDFANLLLSEVHDWNIEKSEHAAKVTKDWVIKRRSQFLHNIASSIDYHPRTTADMAKSH
ncbi:MAG: glycosyltransferase [Cyanobacteria bacterium P01_D01_bin.156]